MPLKKYSTIEERLQARRECQKVYAKKRRDKLREEKMIRKQFECPKKKLGRPFKYETDEERLEAKRKQVSASVLRLYYRKKEEKEKEKEKIEVAE